MLKIVMAWERAGAIVLHLEGQLVGPWVGELERVSEPFLTRSGALHLDLSLVSFVGRDGVELLTRLRDRRAQLFNCSRFVAEQLRTAGERANGVGTDRA